MRPLLLLLLTFSALLPLRADEGMWLYTNPPLDRLKQRYNFQPTKQWLDHMQKSSVRFNNGGSGSFVSPNGLAMTNHHVASDCIAQLSTKENDLVANGFTAKTRAEERRCPGLELNQLISIEDVTAQVNGAVTKAMDAATAQKARQAVINRIEKESLDRTKLRSDVVTLYNGGLYHLYRYKRYTDVRLAFAPELAAAFFGGDPDNFEYPRYNLDVAFLRVYENDQPAKIDNYFRWSKTGVKEGDLIFVSGHPGRTNRLDTMTDLEFSRDVQMPLSLNVLRRIEVLLQSWGSRSLENARRAHDELFSIQNSRKARSGMLAGLMDPDLMKRKQAEEQKLRQAVNTSPDLKAKYGSAWDEVDRAVAALKPIYTDHYLLERGNAFNSRLFSIARTLVRHAGESRKPNAERLREYSESGLESLKLGLFSTAPVYKDLEIVTLGDSLAMFAEMRGYKDPLVQSVLAGRQPKERAAELINGSSLQDVDARKKLFEGGMDAVRASKDPLIQLALAVDPPARKLRETYEQQVDEPMKQAYAKIAQARFAVFGENVYPDATFTLRLAYGDVRGYTEAGEKIPAMTTLGGTFDHAERHGNADPFKLPPSWMKNQAKLNASTPYNFVSTADIIGGNSGSPVLNRNGEIVGIIFDGNIHSLVLDYIYTDDQARAVSVHSEGILEALRKIYGANTLIAELTK